MICSTNAHFKYCLSFSQTEVRYLPEWGRAEAQQSEPISVGVMVDRAWCLESLTLMSSSANRGSSKCRHEDQTTEGMRGETTRSIRGSLLSSLSDIIEKAELMADGRHAACHGCHFTSLGSSGGQQGSRSAHLLSRVWYHANYTEKLLRFCFDIHFKYIQQNVKNGKLSCRPICCSLLARPIGNLLKKRVVVQLVDCETTYV